MVDIVLIKKLLIDLRERKMLLEGKKIKDFKVFQSDPFLHNAVQHMLEVMVEVCIDIGNHIISDEGWSTPSSNKEIFEILEQHGVISKGLMKLAKKMTGFRNIIVHMYEKVDLEEVYVIYKRHLKGFESYASEIEKFILKRHP
jgi:uncharacterized protein YutE (UPF0331/DUF86 family)